MHGATHARMFAANSAVDGDLVHWCNFYLDYGITKQNFGSAAIDSLSRATRTNFAFDLR